MVNTPTLSDEELFHQFLADRDRTVLGVIFKKYMTLVFGVCMKYLGEKHAAQDATMDVFERLSTANGEIKVSNFKAYLYVVAKNHCLMKKRGEKHLSVEINERDMESAVEVHPLDDGSERERLLKPCIEELKDLQKHCIEAFYLSRKSYLEISHELKVTLNAVKSHIQNGKRNLKICIEERS